MKEPLLKVGATSTFMNFSLTMFKFCKIAQDSLSSIASSYEIPRLYTGALISLSAGLLMTSQAAKTFSPLLAEANAGFYISTLYAVMMFSSSYVEEEQQFWYWLSSAWTRFPR